MYRDEVHEDPTLDPWLQAQCSPVLRWAYFRVSLGFDAST